MALPTPLYLFRAFSALGFFTQWVTMILNGSFVSMLRTFLHGSFPSGTRVKTVWTGFPPLDWFLGLLVIFFGSVNHIDELPDQGPILMLLDLIFTLTVFNLMSLVEDRRNRKTGPLRGPAFWQFVWNWGGAASVLPVYTHLYLTKRGRTSPLVESKQAQAFPLSAIWIILISLPAIVPSLMGWSTLHVQNSIAVWFLAPLTLSLFQDACASILPSNLFPSPVTLAYYMIGATSAAVHMVVAYWAFTDAHVSWTRIYWPDDAAVRPGPTHLTEGSMLFMQWDHVLVYLIVGTMAVYMLAGDQPRGKQQPWVASMLLFVAMTVVAGPGASLAWLLCRREGEMAAAAALKQERQQVGLK
ncbi:hypothetical protein CDD81_3701 [Ophiocordyceps australis]|uniref:Uncharacterized protein n=1 Tax=Ophiocordyceps australis TaxID=1399860 RepID=A0A2C5XUS3_9HYPO|nr:hypothetical protein CDD81_3701 [Ophiocordyceps australis]